MSTSFSPCALVNVCVRVHFDGQTCIGTEAETLGLSVIEPTNVTYSPSLISGELLLSFGTVASSTGEADDAGASTSYEEEKGVRVSESGGVIWNASLAIEPYTDQINWTVFPSIGLLAPGNRWGVRLGTNRF